MSAEPLQSPPSPRDHTVRFYQSDARLCDVVGMYLHGGLERGEAVVVFGTDEHRRGFTRVLAERGADVESAVARAQLLCLDAEDTLGRFMVGGLASGRPDPIAFRRIVGGLLERARDEGRYSRVRAYGDMVSILLRLGNETATTRLEELWNELALTHPFHLYCAYGLGQFDLARHRDVFEAVCAQHSHVFPGESYDEETPSDEQSRRIAALQQRAQALEAEIAERRRVESALRLVCEASAALGGSLDYNEALARVALLAVRETADWCAVDLVEADGGLRRLAAASRDAVSGQAILDPPAPMQRLDRSRDAHGPWRVLDTGQSEVGAEVSDPELRRLGMRSSLCAALKANGRVHGVLTLATADGARRYGTADVLLVEDLAGRAAVAIETARLCDELRRADRRKDEFLATLSHELRSPLNAIVGWTHLLRTGSLDANGSRRALETIARNATAQNRLIGDILDMQRLASGKLRLTLSALDLAAVVESAVDTVRPAAQAKGIELVVHLERGGGPVLGDADRLQQVVWNLLSNAVKFTPAGRVEIRQTTSGSHVEITVEDDGPGIAPDFVPYVFDRFRQADASATRRHGGLGLGLAIARTLVELHGGTIEAANRQGGGARFRVRLPHGTGPDSTRVSVRGGAEGTPSSSHVLHGIKVLVVDDDVEAREVVAGILSQRGAEVFVAMSGTDALPLLRRERPHVLICDIEMPDEDGYNLLRKVRALPASEGGAVPAVALTGHARAEDSLRALNAGFQAHVAKPTHPEGLIAIVARLADKHR